MPVEGETHIPALSRAGADATTAGVCTVLAPDDVITALTAVNDGAGVLTCDPLVWTAPGEWRLFWAVTGGGAGRAAQIFSVEPADDITTLTGGPPPFATTADLARYLNQAPHAGAREDLADATAEIERITRCAVYGTDSRGMALDAGVRRALADATCELVAWWEETGLDSGARAMFTNASIGGVSLGMGGANTQNAQANRIGPKVWTILLKAGLINAGGVRT